MNLAEEGDEQHAFPGLLFKPNYLILIDDFDKGDRERISTINRQKLSNE